MDTHLLDAKGALQHYLQGARDPILWKLDGLGERDLRLPRTPTGTNLLGIVRHVANVEIGYFGPTFGREWPDPDHPLFVTDEQADADPQADWWVPAEVSAAEVIDFYRAVWAFSDATIADLDLDARGAVPWWPPDHRDVSLARIIVHVISDTTRHGGHADILREAIDGAAGLRPESTNLPDLDWASYTARLTAVAEQFPPD
ncbi:DinB family protein [Nocardioides KLBMP 9356]|uniref:DinB family protein n=1 Tax=Nocardioides potassii TaxID=2911371 RepID=A0ABS9HDF7_9ACTN|nr:DinB family protein [Nocardioides potassii]MCF6378519.1 DinB family protein [Nocardioides potassii]